MIGTVVFWQTLRHDEILRQTQALRGAELYARMLEEVRTSYTANVVERVQSQGLVVSHDYREQKGAIPLPATFSIEIGHAIGSDEGGAWASLYSAYPFPWRESGLHDDFSRTAWDSLNKAPNDPFYREETIGGEPFLRYAVADVMRSSCVTCHNTHPDSPKTDWKVGDVRGVLEVQYPMPKDGGTDGFPWRTAALAGLLSLAVLVAIHLAFLRQRRDLTRLERLADARSQELRETSERLARSQRMEAIGQLTGSIAHDFNNILSGIIGFAGALEAEIDGELKEDVQEIIDCGERGTQLTRQLMVLARRQAFKPRALVIEQVVEAFSTFLRRVLREDIEFVLKFEDVPPTVLIDQGQLEQVVMNLVLNARDAMPLGGTLTIETRTVERREQELTDHEGARPGAYVQLSVTDTGTGMSTEVMAKIFDPLFTTKEEGKGTGLGLATVEGIVNKMDGFIEVTSVIGEGTTFDVFIPTVDAPPMTDEETSMEVLPRGEGTILLVEDDDAVRRLTARTLRDLGYEVLVAKNAGEGLLLFEERPGEIDLVLTDVIMPRVGARTLTERLRAQRSDLTVVYMSGYADEVTQQHIARGEVLFVAKPFTASQLAVAVHSALKGTRGLES